MSREGTAYELKFLVTEQDAQQLEHWAREHLALDPYSEARQGRHQTTCLCTDTPELDVYYRSPWHRRNRFRIRRYGKADWLFLERKKKRCNKVVKQRIVVPVEDLNRFAEPTSLSDWEGAEFHTTLARKDLMPVCLVRYERTAFASSWNESPLHLAFDRQVQGCLHSNWSLETDQEMVPLLDGGVVVEMKYLLCLPAPFKELIHSMRLSPQGCSKFRKCLEVCNLPASGSTGGATSA